MGRVSEHTSKYHQVIQENPQGTRTVPKLHSAVHFDRGNKHFKTYFIYWTQ